MEGVNMIGNLLAVGIYAPVRQAHCTVDGLFTDVVDNDAVRGCDSAVRAWLDVH